MNENYPLPVGYSVPKKKKSRRTPSEFMRDVSLGLVGLLSLPFAYTGRMLMFALAIIYVCSLEGWTAGKKV